MKLRVVVLNQFSGGAFFFQGAAIALADLSWLLWTTQCTMNLDLAHGTAPPPETRLLLSLITHAQWGRPAPHKHYVIPLIQGKALFVGGDLDRHQNRRQTS